MDKEFFTGVVGGIIGLVVVCALLAFMVVSCNGQSSDAHREQRKSQVARARACHVEGANPRDIAICLRLGK